MGWGALGGHPRAAAGPRAAGRDVLTGAPALPLWAAGCGSGASRLLGPARERSPVTSAGTWRGFWLPGCVGPQGPGGGWAPGAVASPAGPPSEAASPASCRSGGIACAPPVALRGEMAQALPLPGLRPHVEGALLPSEAAVALLGRRGDVGPGARLPHFWAPVALGFARGAAGSLARAGGSAGTAKAHVGFLEPVPQAGGRGCPGPPRGLSLPHCQGGAAPASVQVTPRWPWLW